MLPDLLGGFLVGGDIPVSPPTRVSRERGRAGMAGKRRRVYPGVLFQLSDGSRAEIRGMDGGTQVVWTNAVTGESRKQVLHMPYAVGRDFALDTAPWRNMIKSESFI
ncbi:hypothetical protein ABT282_07470 [Streptomyces sp. NPDC000927]|uniref:hypothetical protein n=1 Tax=Streptomyces sp. NPDC000927 TaxID=3154371 RepID=UPI0033277F18